MGEEKPPKDQPGAAPQEPAYGLGKPLGVTNLAMLSSLQLQTLGQALDRCVTLWGDRELLVFPERRMRPGDLREEVNRLARGLLSLGVQPGEHVAVWLANCPEYAVAELAIAKIGAAMAPVDTGHGAAELEHVLRQTDATTLVLMPRLGNLDCLRALQEICPEWSASTRGPSAHGAVPHLQRAITVGFRAPGLLSYDEILERGDAAGLRGALEAREAEVKPEDILLLQYTPGTTARPKAVMLAHGQVLRNAWQMARRAGFVAADRVLSDLPLCHASGAVCALLGAVTMGHALLLTPLFDPGETLRIIEEEKITGYLAPESMFSALRAHPDFSRRSRATLSKGWSTGAAPFLRMVAEEIGIRNVCSLYSLTEGGPNVAITDWRDTQEKRFHSMGRPQAGVEVKIRSLATEATAGRGERGEICVRGWSVMKGYYGQAQETLKAIDAEGWLHTADLGFMDGDGYLVWTGRLGDILHVGGESVSVLEIERALCMHPAVQAAAVVGIPDRKSQEVPAAFVQLKPGESAGPQELIEYCAGKLAAFKTPRLIRFIPEFEITVSGKIRKYTLRDALLAELEQAKS